jgi:hypothetical protein
MLIGLFFLRARERGVRERGEGQIAQIALGSKQLKGYYIRELFFRLKIALGYFSIDYLMISRQLIMSEMRTTLLQQSHRLDAIDKLRQEARSIIGGRPTGVRFVQ